MQYFADYIVIHYLGELCLCVSGTFGDFPHLGLLLLFVIGLCSENQRYKCIHQNICTSACRFVCLKANKCVRSHAFFSLCGRILCTLRFKALNKRSCLIYSLYFRLSQQMYKISSSQRDTPSASLSPVEAPRISRFALPFFPGGLVGRGAPPSLPPT